MPDARRSRLGLKGRSGFVTCCGHVDYAVTQPNSHMRGGRPFKVKWSKVVSVRVLSASSVMKWTTRPFSLSLHFGITSYPTHFHELCGLPLAAENDS